MGGSAANKAGIGEAALSLLLAGLSVLLTVAVVGTGVWFCGNILGGYVLLGVDLNWVETVGGVGVLATTTAYLSDVVARTWGHKA